MTPKQWEAATGYVRSPAGRRLFQEAPASTMTATIAEGPMTGQPEDVPLPQTPHGDAELRNKVDFMAQQIEGIHLYMAELLAAVKHAGAPAPAQAAPASASAPASALASTIAPLAIQQFQYPSKRLVPKVVLNLHDAVLFCAQPSRFTPNVYALYAWARKQNEDTFSMFENSVAKQGYVAAQAIFDFPTTIEA